MGLFVPQGSGFQWYYSNIDGVTPGTTMGTFVQGGNGSYGSWVSVASGTNLSEDVYGVLININSFFLSATNRLGFCDVGVDNTGGTNYTTVIPSLVASKASQYNAAPGGISYYFPLFIKAGSSVAVRAISNVSSVSYPVAVTFYGSPSRPELVKTGSYVEAVGIQAGLLGTNMTLGTSSKGNWTFLGQLTRSCWWWQSALGFNSASMSTLTIRTDIGAGDDSANGKKTVINDQRWYTNSAEWISGIPVLDGYSEVAANRYIYARGQASSTAVSANMVVYGLGG